jgi:hypothetical protein
MIRIFLTGIKKIISWAFIHSFYMLSFYMLGSFIRCVVVCSDITEYVGKHYMLGSFIRSDAIRSDVIRLVFICIDVIRSVIIRSVGESLCTMQTENVRNEKKVFRRHGPSTLKRGANYYKFFYIAYCMLKFVLSSFIQNYSSKSSVSLP